MTMTITMTMTMTMTMKLCQWFWSNRNSWAIQRKTTKLKYNAHRFYALSVKSCSKKTQIKHDAITQM